MAASQSKIEDLLNNGIGTRRRYDSRIVEHTDISIFKYAAQHKGLLLIEADTQARYLSPPARWVERNMPELKESYRSFVQAVPRDKRRDILCKVTDVTPFRFNHKVGIAHAIFSMSYGKIRKIPVNKTMHYSSMHVIATIRNAIELAEAKGYTDIFLTRIFGGVGGTLWSNILEDTVSALDTSIVKIHYFTTEDPDQSLR